ncbi:hypothetical protein IIO_02348 [Bacillus cereus VD115]|nr:hypothetical protein IIO_02348 [Bacillus cereus VD115]
MNYKQLLLDNFTFKISYIARLVQGMNVKETKDYITVDCGLPADTFNIITLLNNNVTDRAKQLNKEVEYYSFQCVFGFGMKNNGRLLRASY